MHLHGAHHAVICDDAIEINGKDARPRNSAQSAQLT